ncbi:bifunctional diguanylate cyclase/phosphodiesterase [Bradyrhizobium sp.]|uniref:bifunctional diguanylate cyclase/phosphodiesterase n=1 Tax=Bradyrhizobium sp. TaxID=376 RepID=UPI003C7751EE
MALIAAILIGTVITVDELRERAIKNSVRELDNTVRLLARHFDQQFEDSEVIANDLISKMQFSEIASPETFKNRMSTLDAHLMLKSKASALSYIGDVNIFDSDGKLINSSGVWPLPDAGIADRAYFKAFKSSPESKVALAEPARSFFTGKWTTVIAYRLNGPDGIFLGVMARRIDPVNFENFFASVALGEGAAIAMFHRDGTLLARHPHVESMIGQNFKTASLLNKVLTEAGQRSLRVQSRVDGQDRLGSAAELGHVPIVVVATMTVAAALADWHAHTKFMMVAAALSAVAIAVTLFLIVRQLSRQYQSSRRRLTVEKQRLDTAVNNMTQGLTLFDQHKRLVVCNERYIKMYGLSPDVVKPGCSFRDLIAYRTEIGSLQGDVDEHCSRILGHVARGEGFITGAPDGRSIQVMHRLVADGGWVATHEDVTAQRRQEQLAAEKAAELELMNARFDAALNNMSQGLCLFDAEQRVIVANARYAEIYHISEDQVKPGTTLRQILEYRREKGTNFNTPPDTYVSVSVKQANEIQELVDGRVISIKRQMMANGGWLTTHEDVTAEKRSEELLAQKATELETINTRFDAALSNMPQGLCMFDGQKRLVVWNERFAELYQLPPDLLVVGTPHDAIIADRISRGILEGGTSDSAANATIAALSQLPTTSTSSRVDGFADGRLVLVTRQPMPDGGWLATHEDITERRRAEAEIVYLARHDVLTGLANRAEFNARLEEASERLRRNGGAVTVMMLDLDKFKAVNDALGHPAGDQLLVEVARRLKSSVRETDVLARLGGDEFAIIQEGEPNQHEGAIALALRIINAITQPFDLCGHQASIGTCIGIALGPEHGVEPEELMKSADLALYDAKSKGGNDFGVFQAEMLEVAHTQKSAERELRDAIAHDEFELHYQPLVDVKTRLPCGVEALVRWLHPTKGLIGPDRFIPLAESTGLIVQLGEWILRQACKDATSWPKHVKVAVNISAVQFKNRNLFDVVLCTLVETGLAPERLELEITETSLLENREAHLTTIRQLKNLGVSVALDDFGTGYSSVNYLTIFPFSKIKIDKSFTQGVLDRRDCKAVVASTLALAQGLGIVTTAEGVETEEQFEYMREAGVDLVQGYLFGRAVPISQLDLHNAALPKKLRRSRSGAAEG